MNLQEKVNDVGVFSQLYEIKYSATSTFRGRYMYITYKYCSYSKPVRRGPMYWYLQEQQEMHSPRKTWTV